MKKTILFFSIIFIFAFVLIGCQNNQVVDNDNTDELSDKIQEAASLVEIPNTPIIDKEFYLPTQIGEVSISWTSLNEGVIKIESDTAIVFDPEVEIEVGLIGNFSIENYSENVSFKVTVTPRTPVIQAEISKKIENFSIVESTTEDIELPLEYDGMTVSWKSSAISFIKNDGTVNRDSKDRNVKLTATFTYEGVSLSKDYYVKVLKYTNLELIEEIIETIELPTETNQDLNIYLLKYYDYDIIGTWSSSNEDIVSSNGDVTLPEEDTVVELTVVLSLGDDKMEKTFSVNVLSKYAGKMHQIIHRAADLDPNRFDDVRIKDDKLVLAGGSSTGFYLSGVIETMDFNELVVSWAAVSSKYETVEVMVKVRVEGEWSDFVTYHPWGFGLENKCYDQKNDLIELSTDEVKVLYNKYADAIIYKIILRGSSTHSPELSLISFALNNPNYTYNVDLTGIPSETIYDVPKLYQGAVPQIGNSICSPTTSTMLLKYKGEDFSEFDEYEHRYIALKFKDYGNNIFGNWVYNTVGISSFGYNAYVARMYSIEELVKHLTTGGPVGLSVKGQMTSNEKDYYTAGHLIVCVGYRYDENGNLFLVCNDPNVPNVLCEYTEYVMKNTWRNIAYIVE